MSVGIIICGLNGSGKSTLGRALAQKLNFCFIDNEDLYFPKMDRKYIYATPRKREEVESLLLKEINTHENFVFTSVKGDYGEKIISRFQYAVLIEVEKSVRMQRIRERSYQKFGDRMLQGGDLYEQEERFFAFAESRAENTVDIWIQTLNIPVIRVDGTKTIDTNIKIIKEHIIQ